MVLTEAEEAMVVAFRATRFCLYALQSSIPHLTRSSLHRCLQRHSISRLPYVEGDKPKRQKFKRYPIGRFDIDIAEVQTAEASFTYSSASTAHLSSPSLKSLNLQTE